MYIFLKISFTILLHPTPNRQIIPYLYPHTRNITDRQSLIIMDFVLKRLDGRRLLDGGGVHHFLGKEVIAVGLS